jgi:hypothetical protein
MIHMAYEMDVIDDNHLYQTCLIIIACLVGGKPMMLTI